MARLPEDHANARALAERLCAAVPVQLDLATVQTNIVVFHLPESMALEAPTLSARARTGCAGKCLWPPHRAGTPQTCLPNYWHTKPFRP